MRQGEINGNFYLIKYFIRKHGYNYFQWKVLQTVSTGENVEKGEPFALLVGM